MSPGRLLTARDVGLAAAMNVPWLRVHRRPRVAILATGDEVVMPGEPLGPHQILSSNGLSLSSFVTAEGGEPSHLGIVADDSDAIDGLLRGAQGADLLVTSGGASVGKHDLMRDLLGRDGASLDFWKIAMRPGKPLLFGQIGGIPLLGLPGNPVSSLVCALLFLRPILHKLEGRAEAVPPPRVARLGRDLGANDRRQDYLRAQFSRDSDGRLVATPFSRQDSSMLATLAQADGLIVRAPHAEPLSAGAEVPVIPLEGGALSI